MRWIALEIMDFVLKMMDFAFKNDEFCIRNEVDCAPQPRGSPRSCSSIASKPAQTHLPASHRPRLRTQCNIGGEHNVIIVANTSNVFETKQPLANSTQNSGRGCLRVLFSLTSVLSDVLVKPKFIIFNEEFII